MVKEPLCGVLCKELWYLGFAVGLQDRMSTRSDNICDTHLLVSLLLGLFIHPIIEASSIAGNFICVELHSCHLN